MKNLTFFIIIITLFLSSKSFSEFINLKIIPVKKPILNQTEIEKRLAKEELRPMPKPGTVKHKEKLITKEPKIDKKLKIDQKKSEKNLKAELILPRKKPITINTKKTETVYKSKYYSKKDFALAKKAISEMEKGKWKSAVSNAKKAKDQSIYNFIQWRHLLTKGNQASFFDYKFFIDKNERYPRIGRIKYLAEHKLSVEKISSKKIINWFGDEEPLSGYGKLILGESLIETGKIEEGTKLIKSGWIEAELSKSELRFFRKKYKKYLNANDYIKRADSLAWKGKHWDLKRLLRYLPKDYELLYNARQILISKSYGVDQAITNVPDKLKNDPGLNYDRLKWRRKRGRVDSSLEILLKIKNTKDYMKYPEKWWKEREIIARSLIYKKKYETAYRLTSNHAMTQGADFAAAEWMSGWIALSFLDDPILAIDHFRNFYNNVSYPISLSRGAYWLGKSYENIGDKDSALNWYEEATKYMTTYYGQLASRKIDPNRKFELSLESQIDEKYKKNFYDKDLVRVVYLLDELNKDKYTKHILRFLAQDNIQNGSEPLAAELATKIERYDFAIQVSKIASYEKRFHNKFNYPVISTPIYVNGRKIPENAFILSLIRQESEFDLSANSHAGAKGLMQLMPYTAKLVAKQAKLPYSKSRLTTDPEYNINLGSHYIAGLILEYDGAYPFAIAAYNAGPKRVKYWKKLNKDPQKKQIDYVDWIELIKFRETRNYVQRVLENYNVYRYILERKPITVKNFFKDDPLY
ncbi:lytic transglycosylase domain-containing protein [Candidatus Pelagibacter sp.]|uniref:lytic transglycosylase domain-containing protein n=1 Tax=Candidatus Pelagibacter sp. TaxID=2024849 RepID=UPI003F858716